MATARALQESTREEILDPSRRSDEVAEFEAAMREKVIGQAAALDCIVDLYETFLAGLHPPGRPIGNILMLGPTGTGKTRTVEAVAETLFGNALAMVKINCAELQHSHEIARLIGSPPGYLGHRETRPALNQEALDHWHTPGLRISLVLFDEIEKASDAVWQLLLGILDKATLTLGDNSRVDFSRAIIFMTSNLGAAEMDALTVGGIGFARPQAPSGARFNANIGRAALGAARRKFSPEFLNRIDHAVVFHSLNEKDLRAILEIELELIQQRITSASRSDFLFQCSHAAKEWLLREGYTPRYGARHLKRVLERSVVSALARLAASGQAHSGDRIAVDVGADDKLRFIREAAAPARFANAAPLVKTRYRDFWQRSDREIEPRRTVSREREAD